MSNVRIYYIKKESYRPMVKVICNSDKKKIKLSKDLTRLTRVYFTPTLKKLIYKAI